MIGIVAAWAIPFVNSTTAQVAIDKWSGQDTGRLKGADFKFFEWIQHVPRGLIYFLPWVLLFPFARSSRLQDQRRTATGARTVVGNRGTVFGGQSCPRCAPPYSMPAIVPASWLLGMICSGNALQCPRRWMKAGSVWAKIVAAFVGLGLLIGAIGYPVTAIVLRNRQQVKTAAAEINALVPPNETLYAVNPDYQPVFFYVNAPVQYVSEVENLPRNVRYFVRNNNEAKALAARNGRRCARGPLRASEITANARWFSLKSRLRTRIDRISD